MTEKRGFHFFALSLMLLVLAWAVPALRAPSPARGEEATHRLMTESLLAERDLIFDHRDLSRGYQAWPSGPQGLTLLSHDGGISFRYAQPAAYSLLALPFVAGLGEAGYYLLALGLFLLAAWWARRELGGGEPERELLIVGFFLASAAFGFCFRNGPEAIRFGLVMLGLLLGRRGLAAPTSRALPLLAGLAFGISAALEPLDWVPAAVVGLDALLSRRWRVAGGLALAALIIWGGLTGLAVKLQGAPFPASHAETRRFVADFPIENPAVWRATPPEQGLGARLADRPASAWVHELGYLAGGRSGGLLVLFPFVLLALGLGLGGSWERSRWLPALGFVSGLAVLVASPAGLPGGAPLSGLGDPRLAGLVPLALLLPIRAPGKPLLVASWLAAGLLTIPTLQGGLGPTRATPPGALKLLPLELTRLAGAQPGELSTWGVPGYQARVLGEAIWFFPEDRFFLDEKNPRGVWMRGASEAEVIVVSPRPLDRLELLAVALAEDNELTVDGGAGAAYLRFDTAGKRAGSPLVVPVAPVARDLMGFFPREVYYRLSLANTSGLVPARHDPKSQDGRYLGVFLDFGGE